MDPPADLHTNPAYWLEYDCPDSGIDFDVSPVPRPDDAIHCSGCGGEHRAGDVDPEVYARDAEGAAVIVTNLWRGS